MGDSGPYPGVAVSFVVEVDGAELGTFTSCEGLGVEMVLESREEGGNHLFVHQLPTRLKFPNIKLTRPMFPNAKNLALWFNEVALAGFTPAGGKIQVRDISDAPVQEWRLQAVVPVRWTGPQLSVEQNKVATETLELAHHGFLP